MSLLRVIRVPTSSMLFKSVIDIRASVFIHECGFHIPTDLEREDFEDRTFHFLALTRDTNTPVGTVRCVMNLANGDGRVARLAVLPQYRKLGAGIQLMQAAENSVKPYISHVYALALPEAMAFHKKNGYTHIKSGDCAEHGMPLCKIVKTLRPEPTTSSSLLDMDLSFLHGMASSTQQQMHASAQFA